MALPDRDYAGSTVLRTARGSIRSLPAVAVLIFFIAGLLYLLRFERVDNLGAYRIPPETGLLIPSEYVTCQAAACRHAKTMAKRCADRFRAYPLAESMSSNVQTITS
jgi:hypothetical protein